MVCTVSDLKYKDVINIKNGTKLGFVSDIEINTLTSHIIALVIYGRSRFFGLLGKENDVIIPWSTIELIGEDSILVNYESGESKRKRSTGFFDRLFEN